MGDFLLVMRYDLTPDLAIAYSSTLIAATVPIWIGSRVSTNQKASETMSTQDAYMFPVIASFGLFGLFLAFMWFPREYINMVLTCYFLLFGVGAFGSSFLFTLWYCYSKHWIANNAIGFAFCIQGIALISPGKYQIGCLLLGLLFFYDIFWVFGTDVMLTVATKFDGPIKLLFPKNVLSGEEWKFSLLGLGDIVLPGLFIAFLYRFDLAQKNRFPANFYCTLVAYFLGLTTTIVVMHVFEHGQPALLYLVPFCVITSFVVALVRGELKALLAYTEESEEEEKKKKEEEEKKKKKE